MTISKSNWKRLFVIVSLILLITIMLWTSFVQKYPLKSTQDVWQYLASIHELTHNFSHINDPFFSSGPKDIHYGPYLVMAGIIARTMNINVVTLYLFLGIIDTLFLVAAFYCFYKSLYLTARRLESYVFALFALVSWGVNTISYSGYFSLSDLLLNGAAPAVFGLATSLLAVSFLLRKDITYICKYILVTVLGLLTFLSHDLTGIMLFLLIYAYVAAELFTDRKLDREKILLLILPLAVFFISFAWPYYSAYNFLFHSTSFINSDGSATPLGVGQWISIGGAGIFGVFFVFRKANLFIVFWVLGCMTILFSYLTPFHISLYWRFLPFLLIPCIASLYHELTRSDRKLFSYKWILLGIICVIGVASAYTKYNYRASWPAYTLNTWPPLASHQPGDVLLSDPYTSYIAAGLYGINVVATPTGHQNPANETISTERASALNQFFSKSYKMSQLKAFITKYQIDYVLVNKSESYEYDWRNNETLISKLSSKTYITPLYVLYKLGSTS